jgi:hypothetical protein
MPQSNNNSVTETLTYGVEIECFVPVAALVAENVQIGSYHAGRQIPGMPEGWNAQRDGSIVPNLAGYAPIEVVSPVLRGADGLRQIKAVLATLAAWGAKVNRTCGFHVHVGWQGTPETLRRLVCLGANFQTALFASTGTLARERGNYCKPIKNSFRGLRFDVTTYSAMGNIAGDRYHVINLANLFTANKPTVEFRGAPGTLNFGKIVAYVRMYLGLVEKAMTSRRATEWDAPAVAATSPVRRGGIGATDMARLFYGLGWTRGRQPVAFGALQADGAPSLNASKRELMRLAKKYDSAIAAGL